MHYFGVLRHKEVNLLLSTHKFCFLGVTSIYLGLGDRNKRMTTRVELASFGGRDGGEWCVSECM